MEHDFVAKILLKGEKVNKIAEQMSITPPALSQKLHRICKKRNREVWEAGKRENGIYGELPPTLEYLREHARDFCRQEIFIDGVLMRHEHRCPYCGGHFIDDQ